MEIASQYGASNVKIFGSMSRGDYNDESDVDMLIAFEEGRTLFDLMNLASALEDLVGFAFDIHTSEGLHPFLYPKIMNEAVAL